MRGCASAGQRVVDEFEVEGVDQRLAHAPVVERRAAGVHHETGHARRLFWCGISDLTIVARGTAGKS
jgi:hypothetical protein